MQYLINDRILVNLQALQREILDMFWLKIWNDINEIKIIYVNSNYLWHLVTEFSLTT